MKLFKNENLANSARSYAAALNIIALTLESDDDIEFNKLDELLESVRELPSAMRLLTAAVNRHIAYAQEGKDSALFDVKGKPIKPKVAKTPKPTKAAIKKAVDIMVNGDKPDAKVIKLKPSGKMTEALKARLEALEEMLADNKNAKFTIRDDYNRYKAAYDAQWQMLSEQESVLESRIKRVKKQIANEDIRPEEGR